MADLHVKEGDQPNEKVKRIPVQITGVNFKAVNNYFENKMRTARQTQPNTSRNSKKKGGANEADEDEILPWMEQKRKK